MVSACSDVLQVMHNAQTQTRTPVSTQRWKRQHSYKTCH